MRLYRFVYVLLLLSVSCKVSKQAVNDSGPVEKIRLTISNDTSTVIPTYWISSTGDTLKTLEEEVDIDITRLLPDTFKIMAVGDIMNGTSFPSASYLPLNNGRNLWDSSRDLLKSADLTFGNLEGTVLDGEGDPKNCNNPKTCYLFKMPSFMVANLRSCGFDLMSTANNHANDFGEIGRAFTANALDSFGIDHAGSTSKHFTIIKRNHLKIGLIAFAPNKGTLTFYDEDYAKTLVAQLDSMTDILIISIHGGAEGVENQHVTDANEFYFGENRGNIYQFSRLMIDAGADLILGHGPHVPRAIDIYKDRLIAYSLGNFLTYGRFNLKNENGLAPALEANLSAHGKFISGKIHSFRQSYTYGPVTDQKNAAALKIKKLSEEDFPDSQIIIDEEGIISYLQN